MRDQPFVSVYSWTFCRASSFLNDKMHQVHRLWQQCLRIPNDNGKVEYLIKFACEMQGCLFCPWGYWERALKSCRFLYWVANSQSAKSYPGVMRLFMCGLKHPCEATSLSCALILEVLIFPKFTSWVNICFKLLCWSLGTAEGGCPLGSTLLIEVLSLTVLQWSVAKNNKIRINVSDKGVPQTLPVRISLAEEKKKLILESFELWRVWSVLEGEAHEWPSCHRILFFLQLWLMVHFLWPPTGRPWLTCFVTLHIESLPLLSTLFPWREPSVL